MRFWDRMSARIPIAVVLLALASANAPARTLDLFEGTHQKSEIARIWTAGLLKFDDAEIPKKVDLVRVLAGKHRLTVAVDMYASPLLGSDYNKTYGDEELEIILEGGRTYAVRTEGELKPEGLGIVRARSDGAYLVNYSIPFVVSGTGRYEGYAAYGYRFHSHRVENVSYLGLDIGPGLQIPGSQDGPLLTKLSPCIPVSFELVGDDGQKVRGWMPYSGDLHLPAGELRARISFLCYIDFARSVLATGDPVSINIKMKKGRHYTIAADPPKGKRWSPVIREDGNPIWPLAAEFTLSGKDASGAK